MGRLDRHVNLVRNKLAAGTLLKALAWALLGFAFVVLLNILVDRFLSRRLPHYAVFFWVGLGVTIAGALAYSIWRRPTPRQAAVAIDDRLGLKEKFSTALYVRSSTDPFAAAAVRDAEVTADNVSLRKRFPVPFPKAMVAAITLIVVTLLTARFLPAFPLFADDAAGRNHVQPPKDSKADTQKMLARAMTEIDETPALTPADRSTIEAARAELRPLLAKPIQDEAAARRSAETAMRDMQAIKDKIAEIHDKALAAKNEIAVLKTIGAPIDNAGPLADVQKDIAHGDFANAAETIADVVKTKFGHETPEEQKKTADAVGRLADELKQIGANTAVRKDLADKLQQAGATSQQLDQLAKALTGAANGDKQAQQQVGQIANQITQRANQQPGQTPQQQQANGQQVQQLVKQLQGNATAQQTARNMAAAASALAKQLAAQAKAGQPVGPQGQQAPAGVTQQLQDLQEAADAGAEAQAQQNDNAQAGDGANPDDSPAQAQAGGNGTWKPGDAQAKGAGAPGISAGGPRPRGAETPVGFKPTIATSVADENGLPISTRWVKAPAEKGTSTVALHDVIQSAEKDAADEVDQDRISRPEQAVVKRYFDDLRQEASPAPAK
jgi:hypothetical protein